jgi:GTPase SAR1 family protein
MSISLGRFQMTQPTWNGASIRTRWINWRYGRKCPYCFGITIPPNRRTPTNTSTTNPTSPTSLSNPPSPTNPTCGSGTCVAVLPADFYENKSKVIAIVGGTDSGKTTYMTILAKKLTETNVLKIIPGNCSANIPNPTEQAEYQIKADKLYERLECLVGTTVTENLILQIVKGQKKRTSIFLSLCDAPGTLMATSTTPNQIASADGIIYLLDPFKIHILVNELNTLPGVAVAAPTRAVYTEIRNVFNWLRNAGNVKPNRKVHIPIAFCLSKIDQLSDVAALYLPQDVDRTYMTLNDVLKEATTASDDLNEYLDLIGKDQMDEVLLTQLETDFAQYKIFPLSSLGAVNKESSSNGTLNSKPKPEGVEHPLLWMLKSLKFI